MNYLGRVVSSWKDFYNDLNAANLTGAIDIVVVKQKDGNLKSSPFHVRFGKMGVLRPGDLQKKIEITVNGKLTSLYMKLDESGSAFFVEPIQPEEQTTTPVTPQTTLPAHAEQLEGTVSDDKVAEVKYTSCEESSESTFSMRSDDNTEQSDTGRESNKGSPVKKPGVVYESFETSTEELSQPLSTTGSDGTSTPRASPLSGISLSMDQIDWDKPSESISDNYHPFSDGEVDSTLTVSRADDNQAPYHSDTEVELSWNRSTGDSTINESTMDACKEESARQQEVVNDPQSRDWFFIRMMKYLRSTRKRRLPSLEDGIYLDELDDNKPELMSLYFPQQRPLSLDVSLTESEDPAQESSGFGSTPVHSPTGPRTEQSHNNLQQELDGMMSVIDGVALSLCGRLKENSNEIPEELFVQYQVSYRDFCNNPTLFNSPNLVVRLAGKYYSWQVAAPMLMSILVFQQPLPSLVQDQLVKNFMPKKGSNRFSWLWGRSQDSSMDKKEDDMSSMRRHLSASISSDEEEASSTLPRRQRSMKRKRYHKSLFLTSDQLKLLDLKDGMNEMKFSVTTKFQGTCVAECTLYLWDYTEKIIVSDIDGTITRSDVAGQLLPLFGKDWSHLGVAGLYATIHKNGYQFIYLSARSIGMSKMTKGFLRSINQDKISLPNGPLLLTPISTLKAFAKEVIEKKPEEFKIACLKEIRSLFPEDYDPFYAGFGNKHTDAISYQAVGIPFHRIFTINHKGHLKHKLSHTFQSSYSDLTCLCDPMFPPHSKSVIEEEERCSEDYTDVTYWRQQSFVDVMDLPDVF